MKVEFKWHEYPEEKPTEDKEYMVLLVYRDPQSKTLFTRRYEQERDAFGYYLSAAVSDTGETSWNDAPSAEDAGTMRRLIGRKVYWSEIPAEIFNVEDKEEK